MFNKPAAVEPAAAAGDAAETAAAIDAAGVDFGLALLEQLLQRQQQQQIGSSLVVSPFSLACVLALVHGGARGRTAEQLASLLAGSSQAPTVDVQRRFGAALRSLTQQQADRAQPQQQQQQILTLPAMMMSLQSQEHQQGPQLCAANRLFVDGSVCTLSATYLALLKAHYGKTDELVQAIDFGAAAEAAQMINRFVEETTRGRIRDLVSPDLLQPKGDDEIVAVNAVYFLGKWEDPFKKESTRPLPFYESDNQRQSPLHLQTMCKTDYLAYFQNDQVQVLRLFYRSPGCGGSIWGGKDPRWSMVFVLPRQRFRLLPLLETVSGRQLLLDWARRCQRAHVQVQLPKFRIESTHGDLLGPLKALGVTDAFDRQLADLHDMVTDKIRPLWVASVLQKAFVEVDEAGTEAAAATVAALFCQSCMMPLPEPSPIPFVADQPFLWALCGPDGGEGGGSVVPAPLFTGLFGGAGGVKEASYSSTHTTKPTIPAFKFS